jgi:hypothetical protein
MWWTSAEQPLRLEAYYCTNGIATMIGGLLGYAIGHITTGSLERWMYVFIIYRKILDRKRKICRCGACGCQQTRSQEHPFQEVSIGTDVAGSKDMDLVYYGCRCSGA